MSDNVLQTLQKPVQDVIAPDVRETKVRLESLAKETDTRFTSLEKQIDSLAKEADTRFTALEKQIESSAKESDTRFIALEKNMDTQFKTVLAAMGELKAQNALHTLSAVQELRERVAVLESRNN